MPKSPEIVPAAVPGKRGPKYNEDEREDRRADIARLLKMGVPQTVIAQQLSVTRDVVKYDVTIIRKRWQQAQVFDFNEAMARTLEEIEMVKSSAWQGWEDSRKSARSETTASADVDRNDEGHLETEGAGGGGTWHISNERKGASRRISSGARITERTREGNPAFLQVVLDCIARRGKLLRLEAEDTNVAITMVKVYAGFDIDRV